MPLLRRCVDREKLGPSRLRRSYFWNWTPAPRQGSSRDHSLILRSSSYPFSFRNFLSLLQSVGEILLIFLRIWITKKRRPRRRILTLIEGGVRDGFATGVSAGV